MNEQFIIGSRAQIDRIRRLLDHSLIIELVEQIELLHDELPVSLGRADVLIYRCRCGTWIEPFDVSRLTAKVTAAKLKEWIQDGSLHPYARPYFERHLDALAA